MQNLSPAAAQLPLPGNNTTSGASGSANAAMNDAPGAEDFSRMLARELAGKTPEHETSTEDPDAATPPPLAGNEPSLPSEQDSITTALLALTLGIQPDEMTPDSLQQISGEILPAALSSQTADETLTAAQSSQAAAPSGQTASMTLLAALSGQAASKAANEATNEPLPATAINQTPGGIALATLSNPIPGGIPLAAASNPVPGGIALAALQTWTSAQRNLSQGANSIKPAPGLDSTAPESNKTANFAAYDKFLPPVAADDRIFRDVTQLLAQDSDTTPLPQMGNSSTIATAALIPGSPTVDQNQNLKLNARIGTPAWDGALAQKVTWMVTQQLQVAQLQLNPPNLGPMEVMLTVGNGPDPQTRIEFTSPHLVVREAIQAALPHLREMMADNGISLGSATVSADSFQQQAQAGRQDHASARSAGDMPQATSELVARAATRVHTGLVDTFA